MTDTALCKRCSNSATPEETVLLWDGDTYCHACVDEVCPDLWRYALENAKLCETAPLDRRGQWRTALHTEFILFLGFGALLAWAGFSQRGLLGVVQGLFGAALVCLVQGAIQIPMFFRLARRGLPTVCVADGKIDCSRNVSRGWRRIVPLQDVKWRMGKSRQDSAMRTTLIPRSPVVLVLVPRKAGWLSLGVERYACGWNEETRRLWIGFFSLAGVPRVGRKRAAG